MGLNEWFLALVVTLTGIVFPLVGGIAAYWNVKSAISDAREQLSLVRDKVKDIQHEYEQAVERTRDEAREQAESIHKKYQEIVETFQENFPQFAAMDARMHRLLSEMKLRMPSEDDFNDVELFPMIPEIDRQYIVDSELTVAAISVFGLGKSPSLSARIASIYGTFARFYNLRDSSLKNPTDGDFVRAVSYATRVIDLNRESSEGYRLLGKIYLDRYRLFKETLKSTDEKKLKELLNAAEMELDKAIDKCSSEGVDAGAYYNRALAHYYREDYASAVAVSRRLLGLESKILPSHRERYLPYIYLNLGSFLAKRALVAAAESRPDEARQFSIEAVQAITAGVKDFENTTMQDGGLERLKEGLNGELTGKQELSKLEYTVVRELWTLVRGGPGKLKQKPSGKIPGTN